MSEEYDVFSALDEFRNNDLLTQFKSTAPSSLDDNRSDDEVNNISDESNMGSSSLMSKKTSDNDINALGSGTSKTKKTRGKKTKTAQRFSISPPPEVLLPTTAKRVSPTTQEVPLVIAPPVEGRRHTRSMRNSTISLGDQPATVVLPVEEIPPAAKGRGRGRKRNPIARMYNRREYAAQLAALSTNVDFVDLVSSPVPKINGVINVDSDTEEANIENSTLVANNNSLDLSFDEENPELNIKIIWNGVPETFQLRKYQKFAQIFSAIAERENADLNNLVFNLDNRIVGANDTPASINYKIFEFIHGRVLISKFTSPAEKKKRDVNKISLKIQSDQWKRPMQVELMKTESFKILYIKCAEELNIPREHLKLSFDGELLELNGTPADLDLEGGEAIDLRIKK